MWRPPSISPRHGLEVAVAEAGTTRRSLRVDGGLVIDLSTMRAVDVDRDARSPARGRLDVARFRRGDPGLRPRHARRRRRLDGVAGSTLGGGIGHLTANRPDVRQPRRRRVVTQDGHRSCRRRRERRAALGAARRRRELRRRDTAGVPAARARRVVGGASRTAATVSARLCAASATLSQVLRATSAARPCSPSTSRWRRRSRRALLHGLGSGSRGAARLRSAPGSSTTACARIRSSTAARLRLAVRREPPLLEGALRPRAAGRADRRAARTHGRVRPAPVTC